MWHGKHEPTVVPLERCSGQSAAVAIRTVRTVGDAAAGNLAIEGDNAAAMTGLLCGSPQVPNLRGTVKLCYLDPPFNTRTRFGHYNDDVDTSDWLGDLRRRLVLIRDLLSAEGSVWLHLDDSEQHHGRCLLDEVFGRDAFVATVIWQKRRSRDNRTAFSSAHDYIHVYAPAGASGWRGVRNGLPDTGSFTNPDDDPRGPWRSAPLSAQAGHGTPSQFYTVVSPAGVVHEPPAGRCWTYSSHRFTELANEGRIYWPRGGRGRPRLKRYASEATSLAPSTLWLAEDVGENAAAKKDLLRLFPDQEAFDTPKPERLIERIIHVGSNPGEIVLDPYLGSGTTAAAAMKTGRRWVGIESSALTVRTVMTPRLTRVVEGSDPGGITGTTDWRGGSGFQLCTVGTKAGGDRSAAMAAEAT
jgi:adenine-specific DNA-methyltransferase